MSDRKNRSQEEVIAESEKFQDTYQLVNDGISTMGMTE